MKRMGIFLPALVLCSLTISVALAHHNRESYFDMDTVITFEDVTAVSFKVVNPHSELRFMATDNQGNEQEWSAGALSASHLRRAGLPANLINPGDNLTVTGSPSRATANGMWLYTVVLPNGDTLDLFEAIYAGTDPITPADSTDSR
jgi:hypothetical protein